MVSDIYFPIPPSPYPAFYPISYPLNFYPQSPQRPTIRSPQNISASNLKSTKRHEQVYDANRNHVVPYYYSETLQHCMPNNVYSVPNPYVNKNRHTMANYPYDDRQNYYQRSKLGAKMQGMNSPEISQIFSKCNLQQPQTFRPYSVLETSSKSPVPNIQRPSSVVPTSEQFRPASAFFPTGNDLGKTNEIPEWKARLQKEMPKPIFKTDKPLRQICRIPNCKCNEKPVVDPERFSEVRTLPSVSERSLSKMKNLSLPTLKLDELDKDAHNNNTEAERDVATVLSKPISEQHLGYV